MMCENVASYAKNDLYAILSYIETGGIAITPRPSAPGAVIKAGMPMRPFFGIEPALVNKQGQEITKLGERGALCVKKPWPGLMKTVYGDHERYLDTYLKPYPGMSFLMFIDSTR